MSKANRSNQPKVYRDGVGNRIPKHIARRRAVATVAGLAGFVGVAGLVQGIANKQTGADGTSGSKTITHPAERNPHTKMTSMFTSAELTDEALQHDRKIDVVVSKGNNGVWTLMQAADPQLMRSGAPGANKAREALAAYEDANVPAANKQQDHYPYEDVQPDVTYAVPVVQPEAVPEHVPQKH